MANLDIKLEKNVEAVLDAEEKKNLKNLSEENLQNSLNEIQSMTFDLSDKTKGVTLDTIVTHYNTANKQIEINGEKIPVKWGSDLAAWIQILMIADGRSVWSVKQDTLGIDGKIGNKTSSSIDDYKDDKISSINTIINTPKNSINIKTLKIDALLQRTILANIYRVDLSKFDGKYKQQFNWAKKYGILDANYMIRGANIDANNKTFVVTIVEKKTGIKNKEYHIGLEKILEDKNGSVDHNKFADQLYVLIGRVAKDIMANNKKLAIEKEKKGLDDVTKSWNTLQKNATMDIKNAKTFREKITVTTSYSKQYATLAKKITGTKVTYLGAEYKKLAANINKAKLGLDELNILTHCPNYIKERYATFKNNVGNVGDIAYIKKLNELITEADTIIKAQQTYEKSGMVKMPKLTQDIKALREKLVYQKQYIDNKRNLDNDYNTFYNKLSTKDPAKRGEAKAERTQKVERLKAGTFKYSNQPTTCKVIFARAGKLQEYDNYVKKYNMLMRS